MNTLCFNTAPSYIIHIDLNSCFATIEQQANPFLRGKPIAVGAYTTPNGCILAASVEAKKLGIKTGMRVKDGRAIYPKLIVLPSDPWKYRNVHLKLRKIISEYTNDFSPKSIDEFVLNMEDYLPLKGHPCKVVAQEIKDRIKKEIGEWITVSIGISTNRYLAKIAAGLKKPDGLDEINHLNYLDIYSKLKLTDLTGIKMGNSARLNSMGIYNVLDFYNAPLWKLKAAFHSITGYYWQTRLHGYEIDDVEQKRSSYGNSTALGKDLKSISELSPILARLTEKMAARLRQAGYRARGVHLAISYKDHGYWHMGRLSDHDMSDTCDIFKAALRLLTIAASNRPVRDIAVSVFGLSKEGSSQLKFFENVIRDQNLTKATDKINQKWGDFTLHLGRSFMGATSVKDRIAFGGLQLIEPTARRE